MPSAVREVETGLHSFFASSLFLASVVAAMFTVILRLIKKSYKNRKEIRHSHSHSHNHSQSHVHKPQARQEASSSPSSCSPGRTCSSPDEAESPLRLAWHRKMYHTMGRASSSLSPAPSSSGTRFYANIVAKQQMVVQMSSPCASDDCASISPIEMRPRRMSHDCNPFRPQRTASSHRRGDAWDVMADFGRLLPGDHVEHERNQMFHPGLWEAMHAGHHPQPVHEHRGLEQPSFEELASTSFSSSERYFDEWGSLEEHDRHSPLRRSPTYPLRRKSIY